jgi:hypothetical protein
MQPELSEMRLLVNAAVFDYVHHVPQGFHRSQGIAVHDDDAGVDQFSRFGAAVLTVVDRPAEGGLEWRHDFLQEEPAGAAGELGSSRAGRQASAHQNDEKDRHKRESATCGGLLGQR